MEELNRIYGKSGKTTTDAKHDHGKKEKFVQVSVEPEVKPT